MTSDRSGFDEQRDALRAFVARRVQWLQSKYLSESRATGARCLAELRRAAAQPPGAYASVWGIEFEGMPDSLRGRGPEPSRGESAAHESLTLYAIHQQSQDDPMHVPGPEHSLGCAVSLLVKEGRKTGKYANLEAGELPTRFAALSVAQSDAEEVHYLRQIVQLLKTASIPLDYGALACDIFDLRNPYRAQGVRLRWGRDYARQTPDSDDGDSI